VRKEGALVDSDNDESNYVRIETMHPSIENYRSLYAEDLSQRLGLNETRLKPELTFSVLLNPLFGLEKRIVGAGLLTSTQYYRAKSGKYYASLHLSASIPPWLGIPFWDSVSWDYRNSEFRFRFRSSGTFRRKSKSENLKTVQVENRNSGTDFSGIPEFR
jgi:hypothetical protein